MAIALNPPVWRGRQQTPEQLIRFDGPIAMNRKQALNV